MSDLWFDELLRNEDVYYSADSRKVTENDFSPEATKFEQ